MKLRCKLGFHSYTDWYDTQFTKHTYYGSGPGMRMRRVCRLCGKIDFMKLNMSMPTEDLYKEELWRD